MLSEVKAMLKNIVADDEFFDLLAQMHKKMYEAMIKAGFTPEEAVSLTASQANNMKMS